MSNKSFKLIHKGLAVDGHPPPSTSTSETLCPPLRAPEHEENFTYISEKKFGWPTPPPRDFPDGHTRALT